MRRRASPPPSAAEHSPAAPIPVGMGGASTARYAVADPDAGLTINEAAQQTRDVAMLNACQGRASRLW